MRLYHAFVRAVRSPAAVAAALLILSSGGIPPSPSRAQTLVLNPALTGPIPATVSPGDPSHDYPFFSTTVDLASDGYVEEEFFFEGTVSRFDIPSPLVVTAQPRQFQVPPTLP